MISKSYSISRVRSSAVPLLVVALLFTASDGKSQDADNAVRDLTGINLAGIDVGDNQKGQSGQLKAHKNKMKKAKKEKIKFHLSIPKLLQMSSRPVKIAFQDIADPGVYDGDKVAEVSLSTNTKGWSLVCDTAALTTDEDIGWTIPLKRIRWELTRSEPKPLLVSGFLSPGVTFLKGHRPVEDLEISISFSLEILPTDPEPATTHNLNLSITIIGKVNDE